MTPVSGSSYVYPEQLLEQLWVEEMNIQNADQTEAYPSYSQEGASSIPTEEQNPILLVQYLLGEEEMVDVQDVDQAQAHSLYCQEDMSGILTEEESNHSKQQAVQDLIEMTDALIESEVLEEAVSRIPDDINTDNVLQIIKGFNTEIRTTKERVGYDKEICTRDHLAELDELIEEERKSLFTLWNDLEFYDKPSFQKASRMSEWLKNIKNQSVLDKVTSLSLIKCEIVLLPEEMRYLRHLKEIDLRSNQINLLPEWIGYFVDLKVLKVSFNLLKKLPESLCECNSLEVLDVSNNQIEEIPVKLRGLKSLRAANNPLRVSY